MTQAALLLMAVTTLHRYVVRRDQILELRRITGAADAEQPDERGRPLLLSDLGQLLDPHDIPHNVRRHGLVVPTRRRKVVFLVERVEDFTDAEPTVQPFAPLLSQSLARPWFLGAVVYAEQPLLVLDLRQIAQDVVMGRFVF